MGERTTRVRSRHTSGVLFVWRFSLPLARVLVLPSTNSASTCSGLRWVSSSATISRKCAFSLFALHSVTRPRMQCWDARRWQEIFMTGAGILGAIGIVGLFTFRSSPTKVRARLSRPASRPTSRACDCRGLSGRPPAGSARATVPRRHEVQDVHDDRPAARRAANARVLHHLYLPSAEAIAYRHAARVRPPPQA